MIRKINVKQPPIKNDPKDCRYVKEALDFMSDLLFANKIRLHDIPIRFRTIRLTTYTIACRISRGFSVARYDEDLAILKSDITSLGGHEKIQFQNTLESLTYLRIYVYRGGVKS